VSGQKTHWKKLQNKDYLGEYDFAPGEEKTVTITAIDTAEVMGDGGLRSQKPIMRFREPVKPLIVNTTNFKTMQRLFLSKYIEDWTGKRVILYGDPDVRFGKEVVGGVRVKKELPAATVCSDCGQIIQASGKFSAQQIAQAAQNRFGRVMCLGCAEKAKGAADGTE